MSSVLILGSKGMLGQELVRVFKQSDTNAEKWEITAWDKENLDVTNEKETRENVMALWPDVIINATAYNAVDKCEESEEEYKKAIMLNTTVPGLLADVANDLQAVMVHYSTDYVFDGKQPKYKKVGRQAPGCCGSGCEGCSYNDPEGNFEGYKEHDLPNPLQNYGKTKWEGEKLVEKNCPDNHYIIRLSKLFGKSVAAKGAKKSFFDIMLEQGHKILRESASSLHESAASLRAVDGEVSNFTYASDLAEKTREIVEKELPAGIYHVTNTGAVTWYEATKRLFELSGLEVDVEPVSPDAFSRAAKRATKSTLLSSKIDPLRPWDEALEEYLKNF